MEIKESTLEDLIKESERLKAENNDLRRKGKDHDIHTLLSEISHLYSLQVVTVEAGQAVCEAINILKKSVEEMNQ
jgi:hypothetical protein